MNLPCQHINQRIFFQYLSLILLTLPTLHIPSAALAIQDTQASAVQQQEHFESRIRPLIITECLSCHGAAKQEGGLRLDRWENLIAGGDSGPAIDLEDPDSSLLLEAIEYQSLQMPPDKPLDNQQVAAVKDWLNSGAYWPADQMLQSAKNIVESGEDWWCVQPLNKPRVPEVADQGWAANEIDKFVFRKLQQNGITPAVPALHQQLIRRLHYTITGLPPIGIDADTEKSETAAFIDRLLDSPAYGENQARFWLDLVRYADSDGYRADHARPEARLYRDYVIGSFQADKPYDQFVREQLAGDEIDPGNRDSIVATMFLRHWIYEHNQRDVEGQWQQILDDITATTAESFLALGVKCARCHDHKFDPLLQKDYYRLKAFFAPLLPTESQPVATAAEQLAYRQQYQHWANETDNLRKQLRELQLPVLLKHATREGFDKFIPEIKAMVLKREHLRSPYEQQIAKMAERQYDLLPEKLPEWLDAETETRRQQLLSELAELDYLKPTALPAQAFVVCDVGLESPPTCIPTDTSQTSIEPGFPTLLDDSNAIIESLPELESTGRRTALANWIADRDNPLTARVIVNRIWQQHFGRGLVANVNDFGTLTGMPSHPELLDWLAATFIEEGWSLKKLHRRILNSATYQQSALRPATELTSQTDPANILLWRMNPRRLSAEEICDTILAASGEMKSAERTIYQKVARNSIEPRLGLFDFPDRIDSVGKRHRTTTATQALNMMNSPWIEKQVQRIEASLSDCPSQEMITILYDRLMARKATKSEVDRGVEFLRNYQSMLEKNPTTGVTVQGVPTESRGNEMSDKSQQAARQALIHVLLNSNEMIYVD